MRYWVMRIEAERNCSAHRHGEFVCNHGSPRNSHPGDMVICYRWSDSRHWADRDFSSWRLVKSARTRQSDFVRASFLRSTHRSLRLRTFHPDEANRVARACVDSVASALGVPRRLLLHSSRVEPGDEDPGAPFGESARLDLFSFRSPYGCAGVGAK